MGRLSNLFRRNSPEHEPRPVVHVDETGREIAGKILFDSLGSVCDPDWSLPQSVGLKGDNRFEGDSLTIVPDTKEAREFIYGGQVFSRHGSSTPLGELSNRLTNEVNGLGRVFLEIARKED